MKIEIKHRWTSALLYTGDHANMLAALLAAIASGVNLSGVNLSGADLSGADLSGADLSGAKITTSQKDALLTALRIVIVEDTAMSDASPDLSPTKGTGSDE